MNAEYIKETKAKLAQVVESKNDTNISLFARTQSFVHLFRILEQKMFMDGMTAGLINSGTGQNGDFLNVFELAKTFRENDADKVMAFVESELQRAFAIGVAQGHASMLEEVANHASEIIEICDELPLMLTA